ncbi:glycerate kinase isoform X2 [Cephus cinctus]|uniref:Glycerate kinase isoform X2 n=1 Tax=Cephus cinctus TaxID=211228 RepID=A0AAJ7RQG2_CEPCN|nr:glycerate kinase isoform X2 [Cephus cinctus]
MPAKSKKKKDKRRKKKEKVIDAEKQEIRDKKLREAKKRRDEIINKIKFSLNTKFKERMKVKEADLKKETKLREKEIRDQKKSPNERKMSEIRRDMKTIIEAGVEKVNASTVLLNKIKFDGKSTLTVQDTKYKLQYNVHMIGWGKEAIMLGGAFEKLIGKHLKKGWLIVPRKTIFNMWNYPSWLPKLDTRITYAEVGTDGKPDEKSVEIGRKIVEYCRGLMKNDILFVILSGGTDDLLCCPPKTISVKDKLDVLATLKASNATCKDINVVRNKLSILRGGYLARFAYPAKVITLIMSDTPGDTITEFAGGPTTNDTRHYLAPSILRRYKIYDKLSNNVKEVLEKKAPDIMDPLLYENKEFNFVDIYEIANIPEAIEGMSEAAFKLGLVSIKLNPSVSGSVREISREYAKMASLLILAVEGKITKLEMYESMKESNVMYLTEKKVHEIFPSKEKWGLGLCLLMGGRPDVEDYENGDGGPNQELALYFSFDWYLRTKQYPILNEYVVWILAGSTSGRDGNSQVAGAYGYSSLGPGVYKRFKEVSRAYEEAKVKSKNLEKLQPDSVETKEAVKICTDLKIEMDKLSVIMPDRVLMKHNVNSMYLNINDGDELLELGTGTGYTYTNTYIIMNIKTWYFTRYTVLASIDVYQTDFHPFEILYDAIHRSD